jgi:sugar/nucleoside kinase (ribokinase family)
MLIAQDAPTSYTVVINPPGLDRIFLHCPGANDTFGSADVPYDRLDGAKLFHFGYPPLMRRMFSHDGAELVALLRQVKAAGVTASLDMAKPDPTSEAGKAPWLEILKRALPYVDVFLPSVDEILFMLDRERFDRMGPAMASGVDGPLLRDLSDRLLSMGAAIVVLKLGPEGLYLRTTTESRRLDAMGSCAVNSTQAWLGRELLAPCFLADVSGTTGAGDCTIAGFLAGLTAGLGPEDTMTSAVAVGACSVEKADATSGIPTWEQVRARMAKRWERRPVSLDLKGWRWDEGISLWRGPGDSGQSADT